MHQAQSTPESATPQEWSRHLAIGRSVADRHPDTRVGYISGSIIEGFGTPRSDLDIFLLTDGDPAAAATPAAAADPDGATAAPAGDPPSEDRPVATYQADGYRIELDYAEDIPTDTEIWPITVLADLPDELAAIDLDDWGAAGAVAEAKLNLAHRLRIGLPILGHHRFEALRSRFDWDRLARILCNRWLASYNNLADDAIGAIEADDAMSAVLASRQALGAAVDALTAARGHTNPKEKWRWRKLIVLGLDEVATAYRAAELDPVTDDAGLLAQSQARLRLGASFVLQATRDPSRP
jgi:hypothetical protein